MQAKIDEIMDNFDFHKVAEAVWKLSWIWGRDEDARIPNEAELRQEARRLLRNVCEEDDVQCVSCGGFRAIRGDDGRLELLFVMEQCETELTEAT